MVQSGLARAASTLSSREDTRLGEAAQLRRGSNQAIQRQKIFIQPHVYSTRHSIQTAHNIQVLDELSSAFKAGDGNQQYLDIGCANGDFTRDVLLNKCGPCKRIVAVDISGDMIRYAREHSSHPKLLYEELDIGGDVSSFRKEYGSFHRIYSFYVLHWLKDQARGFKNIADLLAPGGECLLLFCGKAKVFDVWEELAGTERWNSYAEDLLNAIPQSHYMEDQDAYVSKLLESAGLKAHTSQALAKMLRFPSEHVLNETLKAVLPISSYVNSEDRDELLEDFLAKVITASSREASGAVCFFTSYFLVHAYKPK
ncbi:juvenile hormone acid O-methyltransferase-like [Ornithodoros turicata]|uniref:juvenile hormone acid O-methyltransferase-like n=1 Tax=Ornithodoros turicata TaxID=34597 RepID=UPI003138BE0C